VLREGPTPAAVTAPPLGEIKGYATAWVEVLDWREKTGGSTATTPIRTNKLMSQERRSPAATPLPRKRNNYAVLVYFLDGFW